MRGKVGGQEGGGGVLTMKMRGDARAICPSLFEGQHCIHSVRAVKKDVRQHAGRAPGEFFGVGEELCGGHHERKAAAVTQLQACSSRRSRHEQGRASWWYDIMLACGSTCVGENLCCLIACSRKNGGEERCCATAAAALHMGEGGGGAKRCTVNGLWNENNTACNAFCLKPKSDAQ